MKTAEAEIVAAGRRMLGAIGCTNVQEEYWLVDSQGNPLRMRVDLCATMPNGHFALVECKAFDDTLTPYVDAIIQAASYAEAIRYPVFIGPVPGSRSTLAVGRMDNAMSALHLMAGRLNVGFLTQSESGNAALMLRGQYVMTTRGMSEQFDTVFSYVERRGSRQVRT